MLTASGGIRKRRGFDGAAMDAAPVAGVYPAREEDPTMRRIRRISPLLFEQVARTIDEKTRLYFVCESCGSTLDKVPAAACPACQSPPERYRQVPLPA